MLRPSTDCTDFLWQDHDGCGLLLEQAGGASAVDALPANLCDASGQEAALGKDATGVVSVPGGSRMMHLSAASPLQRNHRPSASRGRLISNGTCLRLLYIPKGMLQQLKLNTMFPMHAGRRASQCTVNMVSAESGASHDVTMVTKVTTPGSKHHRFTTGWSKFCELAGVEIGDEVSFTRQGRQGNELMVHILKNAGRRAV